MKALFELFRRFDARRIFGFIRRLGGMSRPKVKCYDLLSTHALRVEGDPLYGKRLPQLSAISIHALRVEGDDGSNVPANYRVEFLSAPSGWRVTHKPLGVKHVTVISIHALRVEGDSWVEHTFNAGIISIHALRVEGDRNGAQRGLRSKNFYPRPPGGGRRTKYNADPPEQDISIHALRVEGDAARSTRIARATIFLSTPSGWRATLYSYTKASLLLHFYPRPPGGGRL